MLVSNNLEFSDFIFDFIGYFFNSISNNYPYSLKYVEINRKEGFFFFFLPSIPIPSLPKLRVPFLRWFWNDAEIMWL